MSLPADAYLVLVLVVLGAGIVNGATGFGFAIVSLVGFALILDPKLGVIVLSLIAPGLNIQQLYQHRQHRGVVARLRLLLPAALLGSVIGTRLLIILPGFILSILLGLFALWYALSSLRRGPMRLPPALEPYASPGVGLVAGIANGAVGAAGPVLGSYLLAIGLTGREWIFAISTAFGVMAAGGVATLAFANQYQPEIVVLGIGLALPSYLGQRAGFAIQKRFSAALFQRIILLVLFGASASLLARGVLQAVEVL